MSPDSIITSSTVGLLDKLKIDLVHIIIDVLKRTGDKEKNQLSFYGIPLSSRHNLINQCFMYTVMYTGMVVCLERSADLHMAHLMPLPFTVTCFSKIQIGFTFLVPAHLGSPAKRAVRQVCVCASCRLFN